MDLNASRDGAWRLLGIAVLGAAYVPLHRLLGADGDPAALDRLAASEALRSGALVGTAWVVVLSAAIVGLVAARSRSLDDTVPHLTSAARGWESATARGLTAAPGHLWAWACALVAGAATAGVGRILLQQRPTLIDEFVLLRQARVFASGALSEAWPIDTAFRNAAWGAWSLDGWSAVHPPGHAALLALTARLGLLSWLGPALVALTVGTTAALLLRLLDDRPTTARVAAAAVALSPFVWGIGAGYLPHTSAACAVAVALWASVRAADGHWSWAILTGAAAGWAITTRPLPGVVLAFLLPVGFWIARRRVRRTPATPTLVVEPVEVAADRTFDGRALSARVAAAVAGVLPFLAGLAWWSDATAGSIVLPGGGPGHGLSNALGYTGADAVALGRHLFETPVPALAAIGLWLLLRGRPVPGSGLLVSWALAAVLTNGLFGSHGVHRGPHMLYEAAPAWIALTVLAAVGLGLPRGTLAPPGPLEPAPAPGPATETLVAFSRVATVLCLGWALAVGIPERLGSWVLPPASPLPPVETAPALVFVHGSWAARTAARLEAVGMPRDSVGIALRRNDLCRLHEYTVARRGGRPVPPLVVAPLTRSRPSLPTAEGPERPTPDCAREARSDGAGTIALAPVLAMASAWEPDAAVVWLRDLGPAENEAALEAFPDRTPWLWVADSGEPIPYEEGIARLWGTVRTGER